MAWRGGIAEKACLWSLSRYRGHRTKLYRQSRYSGTLRLLSLQLRKSWAFFSQGKVTHPKNHPPNKKMCTNSFRLFSTFLKGKGVRYFRNPCDRDPPTENSKNFKLFKNSLKYWAFTFGERAFTFGERAFTFTFGVNRGFRFFFWIS